MSLRDLWQSMRESGRLGATEEEDSNHSDEHHTSSPLYCDTDAMSTTRSTTGESMMDGHNYHRRRRSSLARNPHEVEVREINRLAKKDTNRVHAWRILLLLVLSATAILISVFTFDFMTDEEDKSFHRAFDQFSRTIQVAAASQQGTIRNSLASLGNALTGFALDNNMTWPFFHMPKFENIAADTRLLSGVEIVTLLPRVTQDEVEAYIEHVTEQYEDMVHTGYMIEKGSLEGLKQVGYHPYISRPAGPGIFVPDVDSRDEYFPSWLFSPPPSTYGLINWNVATVLGHVISAAVSLKDQTTVSEVRPYIGVPVAFTEEEHEEMHDFEGSVEHPHSFFFTPVHENLRDPSSRVVALLGAGVAWDYALRGLLPDGVRPILAVIRNTCNQTFTYELDGPIARFRGTEDVHDSKYDGMKRTTNLAIFQDFALAAETPGHCVYSMDIYPTSKFEDEYKTPTPRVFVIIIVAFFVVIASVFFVFDLHVEGRYRKLTFSAARSNAIVTSLFPETIRDKLIRPSDADKREEEESHPKNNSKKLPANITINGLDSVFVADLFLETSVVFADIAGFTAWSSVREPNQVFQLLEGVYMAFDEIARRKRIFKVETVGDCYVAAAGIPKPRKDHATAAIRFARDIMVKMRSVTKKLEISLGPDTSDLSLRIGIHSGPVTGGMLRGDRARFQLFGDTVNTASRMESTGTPGKIHISEATARYVLEVGKDSWITQRDDAVEVKGKGTIVTYWVNSSLETVGGGSMKTRSDAPRPDVSHRSADEEEEIWANDNTNHQDERRRRLINWNVETLCKLLKQVVARRNVHVPPHGNDNGDFFRDPSQSMVFDAGVKGQTFLDEVKEVIALPEFDANQQAQEGMPALDPSQLVLPQPVVDQLRDYVTCIEQLYPTTNAFHNFEHASHVMMSVTKLMSRIVAPDWENLVVDEKARSAEVLHDHTYGITSDPLTQFACALSALIHDVDHTGVPNSQLIQENAALAELYRGRSVAEQNSLELSWSLLMKEEYQDLRQHIYGSTHSSEYKRFRQLVVNSVLATDIVDKELKELRNARWQKAFAPAFATESQEQAPQSAPQDDKERVVNVNRKATIVIEHLIQASDVSHTMQHWHIYRKWNQRFFEECYTAYQMGRAEKDPSQTWYKGEIGFFDFYIVPLAKKLKDCGVFGKSSDEYLNYATHNREEWVSKGQQVVAEMLENIQQNHPVEGEQEQQQEQQQ